MFTQIEANDYCYIIEGHPNQDDIAEVNYCNEEEKCEQKDGGIDLHPVDNPLVVHGLKRQYAIGDDFVFEGGKKRKKRRKRKKTRRKNKL